MKWKEEVRREFDPSKFTMRTMPKRIDAVGVLWKPVLGAGLDLPTCLDRLAASLKQKTR